MQRFDEVPSQPSKGTERLGKKMKFKSLLRKNVAASKKAMEIKKKPSQKRRLSAVALYLGFGVGSMRMITSECGTFSEG
jgi:hypothetical protein